MSEFLCSRLWNYPIVDLAKTRVRTCCKTPSIQLQDEDLKKYKEEVFLNLDVIKDARNEMLLGSKPERCNYCWNLESSGIQSFRDGSNSWHKHFDKISNKNLIESHNPNDLDIQLDNYCDLKCIYCNEEFSSQWQIEKETHGDIKKYIPINSNSNEFGDLFFSWFEKTKNSFERIAFLGGEPLISPRFYDLLDRVIDSYNDKFPKNLKIYIITNLNTKDKFFEKFCNTIDRYKHKIEFNINVSMESVGERAEFIRSGLNYPRFVKNLNELAQIKGIKITNITTINLLCLSSLAEHLQLVLDLERKYNTLFDIHGNIVTYPNYLHIDLMDTTMGEYYVNQCISVLQNKNHRKYINFLESLKNSFNFHKLKHSEKHQVLLSELDKLSTRRNINYRSIFNEYEYLWN